MKYIKVKQVRAKFHESNKQLSKDGLHAIDVKIDEFLTRICNAFNGHHKRINADIISLYKI